MATDTKPRPIGRPTKFSEERQERICSAIAAGNYKDTAAILAGITHTTLNEWEHIYPAFAAAVKAAEAEAERKAIAVVQKAANGFPVQRVKTVTTKDGDESTTVDVTTEFSWQAAAWYLERTKGDKYKLKPAAEGNTTNVYGDVHITQVTNQLALILDEVDARFPGVAAFMEEKLKALSATGGLGKGTGQK